MSEPYDPMTRLEEDLCVHIFSASATMVGICLTVVGLIRISTKLRGIGTFGDELLGINGVAFLASCLLSYIALRSRLTKRRHRLERLADGIFLGALCLLTIACGLIAWELI